LIFQDSLKARPGLLDFFGLYMQQSIDALDTFALFFANKDRGIKRFLELGTGMGGFAVLLGIAGKINNFEVFTFTNRSLLLSEVQNAQIFDIYKNLSVNFIYGDISTDSTQKIEELIQASGCTVLLCDGGDKPREFNFFAPYLKKGDYILAHDFQDSVEYFELHKDELLWPSLEICAIDIQDTCNKFNLKKIDIYDDFIIGGLCAFIKE